MNVPPQLKNGRAYVPIQVVSKCLGAKIAWQKPNILLSFGGTSLTLTLGSKTALKNDTQLTLDAAPYVKDGRTMVPLRFISEAFVCKVGYDNSKVYVNTAPLEIDGKKVVSVQNRIRMTMGGIINEVTFQMHQKIKAAQALFNHMVINGDSALDARVFDGLDKALIGSTTEVNPAAAIDLSTSANVTTNWQAFLDELDAFLGLLDGQPAALMCNSAMKSKLRAIARRHQGESVANAIPSESASRAGAEGPLNCHPERARPPLPRESKDPGAPIRAAERSEALNARKARILAGSAYLHRLLRRLDPGAAARIHPNDEAKIIRAVEVCLAARQPITQVWQGGREPLRGFRIVRLGLDPDRAALYARIDQRAARMFDLGLAEETATLLAKYAGAPESLAPEGGAVASFNQESEMGNQKLVLPRAFDAMGYRQAVQLLRGELDRPAAIAAAQQAHRNYAKRQLTWFRREPEVHWLRGFGDDPGIQQQAISLVEQLATRN
jgi:tRNA A37 N6-isopentenylltransferase MiaA